MQGGQTAVPGRVSGRANRSLWVKVVAALALPAIAGTVPVFLGHRDRSSAAVEIQDRAEPFDPSAVTSSTPVSFEPPARAYSPLQPASPSLLPTTTTAAPPPPVTEAAAPTTETSEAATTAAPPVTEPAPALAPAAASAAPPPTAPPTTAAPAPAPTNRTLTFHGGSVTVSVSGRSIKLVSAKPAARYEAEVRQRGPGSVFVRFFGEPGWEDVTVGVGADGQPVSQSTFMPGTVTYDAGY
jgi:hypothetical protein